MPKRDILSARIILTICFKHNSRTERWIYRPQSILQTLAFNNNNNNNISIRTVYSIHHRVSLAYSKENYNRENGEKFVSNLRNVDRSKLTWHGSRN